jgi:tRNA(His) 5'-end guanylyltransferase
MKGYEGAFKHSLPARMPVIIRVDGKAFHTWTKKIGAARPFDAPLMASMQATAIELCKEIQGAVLAYTQSDEISILVHTYKRLTSQGWFGNEIQKMVSISAALASSVMTGIYTIRTMFDSRVFVLPESDVVNYFIWRQQDASRNSVQMLARANFSHKQCHRKTCEDLQEMLFQEKGINWNDISTTKKRGSCILKGADGGWVVDNEIPIFTKDREYITRLLAVEEE